MRSPILPGPRCLLAAGLLTLAPLAAAQKTASYRALDNHEGAWLDLVTTSIRPLALHPVTGNLWSVNSHDSTLVEFAPDGTPLRTVRVPWGPVSLAFWQPPREGGDPDLLVVCRNSQALLRIEPATGTILSLLHLASEPADLLVHPNGHAFVSLAGVDTVIEVDVADERLVRRYPIASERPTFMALDGQDVLVAPMISGNNSTTDTGSQLLDAGPGRVLDLEDPTIALQGLADHDLFRITPGQDPVPVARDMGALLFGLGVNPATGDLWQLGTEANNKDKDAFGEPAIRGQIVVNQASLAQLQAGSVVEPSQVINLDDHDPFTPGVQYDPAKSVGQPYAIAFDAGGDVYLTGLLTDNVTQYTSAGDFVREWDVGSIPRGISVTPSGDGAYVYLWGDNTVELYDLSGATPLKTTTFDLGHDPTPTARRQGRAVYFDASHSMFNNASCASCHVELDSDILSWDLSGMPFDDKGPLITQFMRGIEPLVPFHWRGERSDLIDFNGAFDGLLGGTTLDTSPGGEFDEFQEYVFSTLQPANPLQDERRRVVNKGTFTSADGMAHPANAVVGQNLFFDHEIVTGIGSCAGCHTMPTGTSNEINFDEPLLNIARRSHFVVASFNGIWRKRQRSLEQIQLADGHFESRPTLGVGVSAAGLKDDILDFVNIPLFSASQKQRNNIAAFVEQVDSGLAPAVHRAWLLGPEHPAAVGARLRLYLIRQALVRNCDVVVFGEVDLGAGPVQMRWFWERASGRFRAEDSSVADRGLLFFVNQARQGAGRNVVMGLPVGMGRRFGVDFDADELFNADELALGTDPLNPDSDGDGFPDGHEVANGGDPNDPNVGSDDSTPPTVSNLRVVYVTNRVAKIQLDTDEPVTFDAVWTSGNKSGGDASTLASRNHSVLLRDLRPNSKLHGVTIDVTDHGGNTTSVSVPGGVTTLPFVPIPTVVLRNATETEVQDSGGTLHYTITGTVRVKGGGPQAGRRMMVDVFVNGVLTQKNLLGTLSGGAGNTTVDVIENGLSVGDEVTVVVMGLRLQAAGFSGDWSMPDTEPDMRRFVLIYTGNGP